MGDETSSIGFSDPYVVLLEDALGPDPFDLSNQSDCVFHCLNYAGKMKAGF